MLRTGVKHIKPTISGFTHAKPDKAEAMLTMLNLRSSDPLGAGGGGSGKPRGLTSLDVVAVFGFDLVVEPRSVSRHFGKWLTKEFCTKLALYNYAMDMDAYDFLQKATHWLFVKIAKDAGWENAKEDGRDIETCLKISKIVIDDICHPRKYIGLTDRSWERMIGLTPGHKAWQRKWRPRYEQLRYCLQELDISAQEQVKQKV